MASSRSTPAAAAASQSISASFSFLPSTKCLWLRSLYTASATSHPRFLVIHWMSRWLFRVELARRSRLNFSIPTSCPRSFSLCRCFCAANAALPPHLRSRRTRLVSQKLSSVSYTFQEKRHAQHGEAHRVGRSIGSDITSFIAFWRWRFPMNPLGHMVSLMSSMVTSWWRVAADAGELDQRPRGAGPYARRCRRRRVCHEIDDLACATAFAVATRHIATAVEALLRQVVLVPAFCKTHGAAHNERRYRIKSHSHKARGTAQRQIAHCLRSSVST